MSSEWPCDRCDRNPGDKIAPSHAVLPQPQTAPIATCSIPYRPRRRIDAEIAGEPLFEGEWK
jgi:hypothetical protein